MNEVIWLHEDLIKVAISLPCWIQEIQKQHAHPQDCVTKRFSVLARLLPHDKLNLLPQGILAHSKEFLTHVLARPAVGSKSQILKSSPLMPYALTIIKKVQGSTGSQHSVMDAISGIYTPVVALKKARLLKAQKSLGHKVGLHWVKVTEEKKAGEDESHWINPTCLIRGESTKQLRFSQTLEVIRSEPRKTFVCTYDGMKVSHWRWKRSYAPEKMKTLKRK